MEKDRSNLR